MAVIMWEIRRSPSVWGFKEAVFLEQIWRKRQGKCRKAVGIELHSKYSREQDLQEG